MWWRVGDWLSCGILLSVIVRCLLGLVNLMFVGVISRLIGFGSWFVMLFWIGCGLI